MTTEEFKKEFGALIRKTRKARGWSQIKCAVNCDIDYRHYQNIEGGKISLRVDMLLKLCQTLGISIQMVSAFAIIEPLKYFADVPLNNQSPTIYKPETPDLPVGKNV